MSHSVLYYVFGGIAAYLSATAFLMSQRPTLGYWFAIVFNGGALWEGAGLAGRTFDECMKPGPLRGYTVRCLEHSIRTVAFFGFCACSGLLIGLAFEERDAQKSRAQQQHMGENLLQPIGQTLEKPASASKESY